MFDEFNIGDHVCKYGNSHSSILEGVLISYSKRKWEVAFDGQAKTELVSSSVLWRKKTSATTVVDIINDKSMEPIGAESDVITEQVVGVDKLDDLTDVSIIHASGETQTADEAALPIVNDVIVIPKPKPKQFNVDDFRLKQGDYISYLNRLTHQPEYARVTDIAGINGDLELTLDDAKQHMLKFDIICKLGLHAGNEKEYYDVNETDENGFARHVSARLSDYSLVGNDGSSMYSVIYEDQHRKIDAMARSQLLPAISQEIRSQMFNTHCENSSVRNEYLPEIDLKIALFNKHTPSSGIYSTQFDGYFLGLSFLVDSSTDTSTWFLHSGDIIQAQIMSHVPTMCVFGGITLFQPVTASGTFVTLYLLNSNNYNCTEKVLVSFERFVAMISNNKYGKPRNRFGDFDRLSVITSDYLDTVTVAELQQFSKELLSDSHNDSTNSSKSTRKSKRCNTNKPENSPASELDTEASSQTLTLNADTRRKSSRSSISKSVLPPVEIKVCQSATKRAKTSELDDVVISVRPSLVSKTKPRGTIEVRKDRSHESEDVNEWVKGEIRKNKHQLAGLPTTNAQSSANAQLEIVAKLTQETTMQMSKMIEVIHDAKASSEQTIKDLVKSTLEATLRYNSDCKAQNDEANARLANANASIERLADCRVSDYTTFLNLMNNQSLKREEVQANQLQTSSLHTHEYMMASLNQQAVIKHIECLSSASSSSSASSASSSASACSTLSSSSSSPANLGIFGQLPKLFEDIKALNDAMNSIRK